MKAHCTTLYVVINTFITKLIKICAIILHGDSMEYQNTLNKLHKEVLRWITLASYQNAANKLGVLVNKKIALHKNEQIVFSDFNIYEEVETNKRVIDVFAREYKAESEIEKLVIEGMKKAHNSLYLIKEINNNQLKIQDLLNSKETFIIYDDLIGNNCKVKTILFTRLIEVQNYYLTSGLKLLFKPRLKGKLLRVCRKNSLLEPDDTHRFINIFHLHRKYGLSL